MAWNWKRASVVSSSVTSALVRAIEQDAMSFIKLSSVRGISSSHRRKLLKQSYSKNMAAFRFDLKVAWRAQIILGPQS